MLMKFVINPERETDKLKKLKAFSLNREENHQLNMDIWYFIYFIMKQIEWGELNFLHLKIRLAVRQKNYATSKTDVCLIDDV